MGRSPKDWIMKLKAPIQGLSNDTVGLLQPRCVSTALYGLGSYVSGVSHSAQLERVEDHLLTSGALNIWACKLLSSVLRSTRSIVPSVGRCLLRSAPNGQNSTTEPPCVLGFCFPDVGCHSPRLLTTPGDPVRLHAVYLINPFCRSATGSLRSICHDLNSCQMSKAAIRRRAMRRSPSRI